MIEAPRLSRHLRETHRRGAIPRRVGPFTAYLHASSPHEALNVAVPDDPLEGRLVPIAGAGLPESDAAASLPALVAPFVERRRTPRVEFLAELHPTLPALLAAHGWVEDLRTPILACTAKTRPEVEPVPGARLDPLLPATPWPVARDYLRVQRDAYGLDMPLPERAPPGFWDALQIGAGLLATLEGVPVAAGGITPQVEGLSDVRGLGVVPAHRRKGLAGFLLAALAEVALDTGADALLAIPDSREGLHLAQKAGFARAATLVSFRKADAAAP